MKLIAQVISWLALAGTIVPPCLYLAGSMELPKVKLFMLVATVVWFVTVPLWMGRQEKEAPDLPGEKKAL